MHKKNLETIVNICCFFPWVQVVHPKSMEMILNMRDPGEMFHPSLGVSSCFGSLTLHLSLGKAVSEKKDVLSVT